MKNACCIRSGHPLLKCTCKYDIINSGSFAIVEKARKETATHLHMMVLQISKYVITPIDFIKYFSGKSEKQKTPDSTSISPLSPPRSTRICRCLSRSF